MATLNVITGNAVQPIKTPAIIAHVCNDAGKWGAGFTGAINRRWKAPEAMYRAWHRERRGERLILGELQIVQVNSSLWVANMVAQYGIRRSPGGTPPIRYNALQTALERVGSVAIMAEASVHMPRIGCGLAGGTWDRVEPLIREALVAEGVDVWVYDLP